MANESINFDELEIFFCGSGSPLSMMPEGAQCMAFVIGSDIYVIDNGKVADSGNHDDLLIKSPLYKNFYEKQIQK